MYTIPASFCLLLSRTRVDPNPELEFCLGHVSYCEGEDGGEEVKRHGGYLTGMLVTIADRKTRHHHVLCAWGGEREELVKLIPLAEFRGMIVEPYISTSP